MDGGLGDAKSFNDPPVPDVDGTAAMTNTSCFCRFRIVRCNSIILSPCELVKLSSDANRACCADTIAGNWIGDIPVIAVREGLPPFVFAAANSVDVSDGVCACAAEFPFTDGKLIRAPSPLMSSDALRAGISDGEGVVKVVVDDMTAEEPFGGWG